MLIVAKKFYNELNTVMTESFGVEDQESCTDPRHAEIEIAATKLLIGVWRGLRSGLIPDRTAVDDAALKLRDALNPNYPADSNWLPEELRE